MQRKCDQIARVFEDSYRSPLSVIIMDDLERLLEYVAIGPRFSNAVLQVRGPDVTIFPSLRVHGVRNIMF